MIRFDGSEAHRRLETFPGKLFAAHIFFSSSSIFFLSRFVFYSSSSFFYLHPYNSFFPLFFFPLFFPFPLSSLNTSSLVSSFSFQLSLLLILSKKNFLSASILHLPFHLSSSFIPSPSLPPSHNHLTFHSLRYKFIHPRSIHFPSSFFRSPYLRPTRRPPRPFHPPLPHISQRRPLLARVRYQSAPPSPPLSIHPTRFRPTFSSRRIDRAESASPIPAYIYRVLYYYAVHPVYSPDTHGCVTMLRREPRPFFGQGTIIAPRRAATGTGSVFSRHSLLPRPPSNFHQYLFDLLFLI